MMGMRRRAGAIAAIVTLVGVLVASGCGSDDDGGGAPAGEQAAKQFVPKRKGGIPGALLPEERKLWKYNFDTGKFDVVEGDASKPYKPDIEKFKPGTKIAYIDPWSSDPFAISIREHFYALSKKYGFEVVYCDTEFKAEKAVECAEQVAAQHPDFVHAGNWQAGSAAALMRMLDKAHLPANSDDVAQPNAIFVGADNYTAGLIGGKAAGKFAQTEWSCKDVWVLLGEAPPEGEAADQRLQGFSDGVQEVCGALPDEQINRVRADSTADQALTATTDWLTAHPQAKRLVSVSLGADRSIGMAKAFQRSDSDAYAVGMTCDGAEIEFVYQAPSSENHFLGCVAFFPEQYPPLIVSTAQDVLEGKPVPNEVHVEHKFLDHQNIGEYYPKPK